MAPEPPAVVSSRQLAASAIPARTVVRAALVVVRAKWVAGTAGERLDWLRRDNDRYLPQPYEQLAETYRKLGHDAERRHVLLAKHRHRRSAPAPPTPGFGTIVFQHHPKIQEAPQPVGQRRAVPGSVGCHFR